MAESINREEQLRFAEERKKRNEVGLYTIEEAVKHLLEHIKLKKYSEEDLKDSLSKIVEEKQVRNFSSFRESDLHLDYPGFLKPSKEPKIIVRWDDLNDVWLPSIDVEWKFPNPFKRINIFDKNSQSSQDSIRNLKKTDWISMAEKFGVEILKNHKSNKPKLSKALVAKEIAEKFKQRGIRGGRGEVLKSSSIERELKWWSKHKNYPTI